MYWSWILTLIGGTAFILAGKKIWWCWYINVACQVLWFIYGWVSHQYGFIASALFFAVVFGRNALDWTKDHRDPFRGFNFNEVASGIDLRADFEEYQKTMNRVRDTLPDLQKQIDEKTNQIYHYLWMDTKERLCDNPEYRWMEISLPHNIDISTMVLCEKCSETLNKFIIDKLIIDNER